MTTDWFLGLISGVAIGLTIWTVTDFLRANYRIVRKDPDD